MKTAGRGKSFFVLTNPRQWKLVKLYWIIYKCVYYIEVSLLSVVNTELWDWIKITVHVCRLSEKIIKIFMIANCLSKQLESLQERAEPLIVLVLQQNQHFCAGDKNARGKKSIWLL